MLMRWHWPPENSRGRRVPLTTGVDTDRSSMALAFSPAPPCVPIFQMTSGSATMSRTWRRGLSEEIGSWKIIWSRVRSGAGAPVQLVSSGSPKRMVPEVGLIDLDDGPAGGGLAAARLAHQPERLALV